MSDSREEHTRLCDRCLQVISEGRGKFFEVRIEAVADPCPPILDLPDPPDAARADYEELVNALGDTSAQEAQDQIHRHVTLSLCNLCFAAWIEDPTGTSS